MNRHPGWLCDAFRGVNDDAVVVQSELSPRSSVEKSIGFLNRVSEVRFLPGAPGDVCDRSSCASPLGLILGAFALEAPIETGRDGAVRRSAPPASFARPSAPEGSDVRPPRRPHRGPAGRPRSPISWSRPGLGERFLDLARQRRSAVLRHRVTVRSRTTRGAGGRLASTGTTRPDSRSAPSGALTGTCRSSSRPRRSRSPSPRLGRSPGSCRAVRRGSARRVGPR